MRIRWVNVWKPFVIVLLGTGVVALCTMFFTKITVQAATLDWAHDDIQYSKVSDQALYTYPPQGYPNKTVTLSGLGGLRPERQAYISYFHSRGAWDYGDYSYGGNEFPFVSSYGTAVRIGSDRDMYRVTPGFPHAVRDVPNSDDLIFPIDDRYSGFHFTYYKDFPSKLRRQAQTTGEVTYSYDQTPDFVLRRPNGTDIHYSGAIGISDNGKWAVLNAWGIGVVRIDLTTFDVKRISTRTYEDDPRHMPMSPEFAISNDGMHVAIIGRYVPLEVYDVSDTCGDEITNDMTSQTPIASPCAVRDIRTLIDENYTMPFQDAYAPSFDDGGGQLTLYVTSYGDKPPLWIQLTVSGYTPTPQLTYLALGDSYSSGEGDITGDGSHYLSGTDYNQGCHISDRSYPFLLRDYYNIPTGEMHSVACSGAQVSFDYDRLDKSYLGQGNRLIGIAKTSKQLLEAEQQWALKNFLPGEIPQIDFVRKYKPDVITLTGGGNDVGFARILQYCASPSSADFVIGVSSTCEYAKQGSELNTMLYNSIDSQYAIDKMLVDDIQKASPSTRIVIIGYPSFVAGSGAHCGLNAGALDDKERVMINDAVSYMDSMLQRLAYDTGVSYVDTEEALLGGRLCESDHYVTGLKDLGASKTVLLRQYTEAFHPNAEGHEKLADAIERSGALAAPQVPAPSSFSVNLGAILTLPMTMIDKGEATVDTLTRIVVGAHSLQPGTVVSIEMHSDTIKLGSFKVASDGSFEAALSMKSVPAGRHVLVLRGTDYTGAAVTYYQFIDVVDPVKGGNNSVKVGDANESEGIPVRANNEVYTGGSSSRSSYEDAHHNTDRHGVDKEVDSSLNVGNVVSKTVENYQVLGSTIAITVIIGATYVIYIKKRH